MELGAALMWGLGSVAVAGLIDRVGLNWMESRVSNSIHEKVRLEPLVFEPGDRLVTVKLD